MTPDDDAIRIAAGEAYVAARVIGTQPEYTIARIEAIIRRVRDDALAAREAEVERLRKDQRDNENFIAECATQLEWIRTALDGEPLSDFAESFPLVRRVVDSLAALKAENVALREKVAVLKRSGNHYHGPNCKVWFADMTTGRPYDCTCGLADALKG